MLTYLHQYLIKNEHAYLLNENNNGKVIMISGAWGSGKTHFWQNKIEPLMKEKLHDKASIYVSLYGKESLNDIKSEVYLLASGKSLLSTEVSTFGIDALSAIKDSDLVIGKVVKAGKTLLDSKKIQKGIQKLKKGGVICFDDFERKSKEVDLNDLFGFISQLAINLECKVIIILNNDVFSGKEAKIFRNVKEKTVSKFFYFNPSPKELFDSIANNPKYNILNSYKKNILSSIKETKELNARIYIQVLDNCLEWLKVKGCLDNNIIRVLVLGTFNFILNHITLNYIKLINTERYNIIHYPGPFNNNSLLQLIKISSDNIGKTTENIFIDKLKNILFDVNENEEANLLDNEQQEYLDWIKQNEQTLKALWKYGYQLFYVSDVDKKTYNEIANFIKTGILLP